MFKKYLKNFKNKHVEVVLNAKIMALKNEESYTFKSESPLTVSGYLMDEDFNRIYLSDDKKTINLIIEKKYIIMVEHLMEKVYDEESNDEFMKDFLPKDPYRFN